MAEVGDDDEVVLRIVDSVIPSVWLLAVQGEELSHIALVHIARVDHDLRAGHHVYSFAEVPDMVRPGPDAPLKPFLALVGRGDDVLLDRLAYGLHVDVLVYDAIAHDEDFVVSYPAEVDHSSAGGRWRTHEEYL